MKFASSVRNVPLCFLIVTVFLLPLVFLAFPGASQAQQSATQTAVRADELTQSAVRQTQAAAPTAQPATQTAIAVAREAMMATRAAQRAAQQTQVAAQQTQVAAQQTQAAAQPTAGMLITEAVTPWPTVNPATQAAVATQQVFPLIDPSDVAPCGLPVRSAAFSSGSATFEMTSDCRYSASAIHTGSISAGTFLGFNGGGPYTINGNGYSIIGPPGARTINITLGVTVNLNNVGIRSSGGTQTPVIQVNNGTLNARNVIFQDNTALAVIIAEGGAQINLTNARFLGNRVQQGVIRSTSGLNNAVSINGAEFQNNHINGDNIISVLSGSLTLEGRIGFRANPSAVLGREANRYTTDNNIVTLTDTNAVIYTIQLPKKKKKEEVRPTLAATPRPRYAASYTALQTATGMTFEATYGLDSGVHFRQLDGAGIGIQSIIDAGYLAALDVYGYVEQGVEVCFPQAGRVIFLDARTIPRAITTLPATARDGMTCVYLNSPGSLVLLPPN